MPVPGPPSPPMGNASPSSSAWSSLSGPPQLSIAAPRAAGPQPRDDLRRARRRGGESHGSAGRQGRGGDGGGEGDGGGGGMGGGVARGRAAAGASVVINDYGVTVDGRDPSSARALAVVKEIEAHGGRAGGDASIGAIVGGGV